VSRTRSGQSNGLLLSESIKCMSSIVAVGPIFDLDHVMTLNHVVDLEKYE